MQRMALFLLVYRITGSAKAIGGVAVAAVLPHILSSLYGGAIADRLQKKYILMFTTAAFAVLSFAVATALAMGWLNKEMWWLLAIATVSHAILMGMLVPARHSIIPNLVESEMLMNAVSLNRFGQNGWQLMAPAAAGFLIEGFGFETVFCIIGGLYMWAFIFLSFLPRTVKAVKAVNSSQKTFSEIKEAFKYLRAETDITWVLIFNLLAVVLSLPYEQLLPVFVDDILKVGAGGLGVLVSASGIGAMAGSFIVASLPNKKRGLMLLGSIIFLGLAIIVFSFSKSWTLSLIAMVFIGLGQAGRLTLGNTLAQHYCRESYRGRIMGIYDMQMSFPGLAVFAIGFLSDAIGVEWSVGGFAILLVVSSLVIAIKVPRLRRLD